MPGRFYSILKLLSEIFFTSPPTFQCDPPPAPIFGGARDTMESKVYKKTKGRNNVPPFCGATWNRTRDTRIFSPLLYQLSYGTFLKLGFK